MTLLWEKKCSSSTSFINCVTASFRAKDTGHSFLVNLSLHCLEKIIWILYFLVNHKQTLIHTLSGGTGIITSLMKDRVFLLVMKSNQEMKQVSLLVSRHSHQILIFKLSTYNLKSIKLQGQLSCSSKDTIFTIPLEENSVFILFLSLKNLIIILFYAY